MNKRGKEPEPGDEVTWRSHGSTTEGEVEKKITDRREEAGRTVAASPEEPQYVVRSEKSGRRAVHKASALGDPEDGKGKGKKGKGKGKGGEGGKSG
ncbi:HVA1 family protein [Actinomadura sp. DSM 109109]|nr:HVA1 family protein [Actinomadura lepetitiana]